MEKLLKKLIEKGWKPRGFEKIYNFWIENWYTVLDTKKATYISFATSCVFREDYWEEQEMDYVSYTFRELVSKESWLRQFVCQNDMVDKKKIWIYYEMFLEENWIDAKNYRPFSLVERLIIESALCDEDKLEDFLLNNINADE